MKSLILHPTDISQWYALISEAEQSTQIILNESTESYLVFLLQRFSQAPQLAESILATEFLECMNDKDIGRHRIERLVIVGDKSLLLSGLFPGVAQKHNVTIDYYIDMGKAAYLSASELHKKPEESELYLELSEHFPNLQTILQAIRGDFYCFDEIKLNPIAINKDSSSH